MRTKQLKSESNIALSYIVLNNKLQIFPPTLCKKLIKKQYHKALYCMAAQTGRHWLFLWTWKAGLSFITFWYRSTMTDHNQTDWRSNKSATHHRKLLYVSTQSCWMVMLSSKCSTRRRFNDYAQQECIIYITSQFTTVRRVFILLWQHQTTNKRTQHT